VVNGLGGVAGSFLAVAMVSRVGAHRVALYSVSLVIAVFVVWPLFAASLLAVFALQFFWSAGIAGFPSVQQTRLVAVAPALASATIAMNSSVGYLGNSVGTTLGGTAWAVVGPRYMAWIGLVFICASLACSIWGERAVQRERESTV
jgi:predicted MFS family arabinose efflux permease